MTPRKLDSILARLDAHLECQTWLPNADDPRAVALAAGYTTQAGRLERAPERVTKDDVRKLRDILCAHRRIAKRGRS